MAIGSASTYSVNSKPVRTPLVDVEDLLAHLALLNAFAGLRKRIDELAPTALPDLPEDKEVRWSWFVAFAVHRFSIWCATLEIGVDGMLGGEEALPPLDVLMVWHAYMLNSRAYAEDCIRVPVLRRLSRLDSSFFFSPELSPRWPELLQDNPSLLAKRTKHWTTTVKRPFDLVEDAAQNQSVPVLCPNCSRFSRAPFFTASGDGYLQPGFSLKCPREECNSLPPLTHRLLGLQKLVRDLTKEEETSSQYLAGTLHTDHHQMDHIRANMIKQTLLKSPVIKRSEPRQSRKDWSIAIMRRHEFSLDKLLLTIQNTLRREDGDKACRDTIIGRIAAAYSSGNMFSVNLSGAVARQGIFIEKILEIHWHQPQFFVDKNDLAMLGHAILRYHRFLTLLARSPTTYFVPTLDIQLAWHTHQLKSSRYNRACKEYLGRYLDYHDETAESIRVSAFEFTSQVWEDTYDMPYVDFSNATMGKTTGSLTRKLLVPRHGPFLLVPR